MVKKPQQIFIILLVSITVNVYLLPQTNCPLSCDCHLELLTLQINCTEETQTIFKLPINFSENSIFAQIKEIILENCFITTIPSNICIFKNLTFLDVSYNQIKELTEDIFNCSKFSKDVYNEYEFSHEVSTIETIDLSNNQIFELNEIFFKSLVNLRTLIMSSNSLSFLNSDVFNNLLHLELLDLSSNKLVELSDSIFYNLINLQFLSINNNFLSIIRNNSFLSLKNLQALDLSNNQISTIPYGLFHSNLSSLVYLNLSYNFLTKMELWPIYLGKIKFVDLKFNYIESFTNNFNWLFENELNLPALNSLSTIDLQYNRISSFDDNTIQQYGICSYENFENFVLNYLKAFLVNNNPIVCDCTLSKRLLTDAAIFLKNEKLLYSSKLYKSTCQYPDLYTDQSILNFGNCSKTQEYSYCNATITIQSNSNLIVSNNAKNISEVLVPVLIIIVLVLVLLALLFHYKKCLIKNTYCNKSDKYINEYELEIQNVACQNEQFYQMANISTAHIQDNKDLNNAQLNKSRVDINDLEKNSKIEIHESSINIEDSEILK